VVAGQLLVESVAQKDFEEVKCRIEGRGHFEVPPVEAECGRFVAAAVLYIRLEPWRGEEPSHPFDIGCGR
jgi:hypothetical protein